MIFTMTAPEHADWSLLEAARSLEGSPFRILFRCISPMIGPAVLAGSVAALRGQHGGVRNAFSLNGIASNPSACHYPTFRSGRPISQSDALAVFLTFITTLIILGYERCSCKKQVPSVMPNTNIPDKVRPFIKCVPVLTPSVRRKCTLSSGRKGFASVVYFAVCPGKSFFRVPPWALWTLFCQTSVCDA
jgi:hypothetical protein